MVYSVFCPVAVGYESGVYVFARIKQYDFLCLPEAGVGVELAEVFNAGGGAGALPFGVYDGDMGALFVRFTQDDVGPNAAVITVKYFRLLAGDGPAELGVVLGVFFELTEDVFFPEFVHIEQ